MSNETIKNYGKSIRSKLLNISKKEDVFHQTILTRFFQERLLYRMSQTRYRDNFYLKGGALMYAYEKFAARPTLDIDFLGNNISNEEVMKELQSLQHSKRFVPFHAMKTGLSMTSKILHHRISQSSRIIMVYD